MLSEINNLIDVKPGDKMNGCFVGITQSMNDGSFVIHHFLSHCLKSSTPVCFVALDQSFGHYNSVSQKFGTNLITQKEANKLVFIEGLKIIGNLCLTDCDKGDNSENLDTKTVIYNLLQSIRSSYNELKTKNNCAPTIIIDNVSLFITLGFSLKDVIGFCHYLSELTQDITISNSKGCLILYCNSERQDGDEQLRTLWNWICHNCSLTIEVLGLASGYCKDVHGEILVRHKKSLRKPEPQRRMQYKLTDKSINMFAAGMSSAVL